MARKIDSNMTGLRYTDEVQDEPGTLPDDPVWRELEPNSYSDFGATITSTARTPITAGRQRRKGRVTDLEAQAGFNLDFTGNNMVPHMPKFLCADWHAEAAVEVTDLGAIVAADDNYEKVGAFGDFQAGHIVLAKNFGVAANNGLKLVTAATADDITIGAGLSDEADPPAASSVQIVGFQADAAEFEIDATDPAAPKLVSNGVDLTTLNLQPGQWVWIGGDATGERFATAGNNGFARVLSVSAAEMVFDKTQNTMATDYGAGKTIRLYYGLFGRNEDDPELIKVMTTQFERSLGSEGFEYVLGGYASELGIQMPNSSKIALDLTYMALSTEYREVGDRKAGTFPAIDTDAEFFNTSSDFVRMRCAKQGSAAPLFGYIQEMNLGVNNNVSMLKALGVLGAFDASFGDFVVTGEITAYFNDIEAVQAVRNSDSLTIDFAVTFNNRGWVFDVPLFTGTNGLLNVEKDQPITIPVGIEAAEDDDFHATLLVCYFPYLPDLASA